MPVLHYLPRLHGDVLCGATGPMHATLDATQVTCARCVQGLQPGISEAAFLGAVRRVAVREGYLCYHTHDSRRSPKGFVDVVCAKAGHPLYMWELKTSTGVTTIEQGQWLETLAQVRGMEVALWRPEDFPTLVARLMRQ